MHITSGWLPGSALVVAALTTAATLAIVVTASAQDAPAAYIVSPEVYKVMAENDSVRVIWAVWKPGQRDNWHSHPPLAVYYLTDCKGRIHLGGGGFLAIDRRAGATAVQPAVKSHAFENTGDRECRLVILERKGQ